MALSVRSLKSQIYFQEDGLLIERHALQFLRRVRFGADHDERFSFALSFNANEAVFLLQSSKPGHIAVFHVADINGHAAGTLRPEGSLREAIARREKIAVHAACCQSQKAGTPGERPVSVIGIVIPLPHQR